MKNRRAIMFFLGWSGVFTAILVALSYGHRATPGEGRQGFVPIDIDAVGTLEINRSAPDGAAERIVISRIDGLWRLESPVAAEADEPAVKRIIDAVALAEPIDVLSAADMAALGRSLKDFGLAVPRYIVTLSSGGRRVTYAFGRMAPSGKEIYARRGEESSVFTVPAKTGVELSRPIDELRRRKLFRFMADGVEALGLKNAGEPLSKLVKKDGSWRLMEPSSMPADGRVVAELVETLCAARILDYASSDESHGFGTDEGYAISLRDVFGNVEKAVLGAADGTNAVWALTPEGAVVHVAASLKSICRRRQKEVEDTRVFPVDAKSVIELSVTDGSQTYRLSRADPSSPWRMETPVDVLADAQVVERLLARALAVRSVDAISEGDGERLTFAIRTGITNYPPCAVAKTFLKDGERLADLHDKQLFRCPRKKIKRIQVKTAAGAGWDATSSEPMLAAVDAGIVAAGVESVLLRTDDFERYGFDRPSFTIMFELDDAESALRKILLGAAAPGGGRFAMIGGADAAFILSAETVSLLTKPVDDAAGQPAPAAKRP